MSPISLKTYGFKAAALLWRGKSILLVMAAALGVGLAIAARNAFDPPHISLMALALLAPITAAAAALLMAGAVLKLAALDAAVEVSAARLLTIESKFVAGISDLRFIIEERTNAIAAEQARLRTLVDHTGEAIKGIPVLQAELMNLASSARGQARAMDVMAAENLAQFKKIDERLASKARADKVNLIGGAVSNLDSGLHEMGRRLQAHHVHDRYISSEDVTHLREEWAEPLGLVRTDANINYLASRIRSIESQCAGRLATTAQAMIARLLAAQSVARDELHILEIGVLFGVASACFQRICAEFGKSARLTLIDPFEGYYDRGDGDLITGAHVTRALVEENMNSCGISGSDYEIIQGLSGDPATIGAAAVKEYDVLLVDGDHSYEGVKQDFDNYRSLVRSGGVIIFDDYGVNEWPDIKRFVDERPCVDPGLTLLAKGFRTAAFRVK